MKFVNRRDLNRALTLGLVAQEHVFVIGPPGTAKSMFVEEFAKTAGLRSFSYLMTQFTGPDEIFGPVDLMSLKNGRYKRLVDGFLPTAELVFLDEVFKANSAILNALLRIMQERRYAHEPPHEMGVPVRMVVGASNELPENGLSALYDRFLLRVSVDYIPSVDQDLFVKLLKGEGDTIECPSPLPDISKAPAFSSAEYDLLVEIRKGLDDRQLQVSDRRWVKAIKIVRANALLEGRDTIREEDFLVLKYVLPEKPEQFATLRNYLENMIVPEFYQLRELLKEAEQVYASSEDKEAAEAVAHLAQIIKKIDDFRSSSIEDVRELAEKAWKKVQGFQQTLVREQLGLDLSV